MITTLEERGCLRCVKYKAKELGITVLELYQRLFTGEEIEFDLCCDGAVKF